MLRHKIRRIIKWFYIATITAKHIGKRKLRKTPFDVNQAIEAAVDDILEAIYEEENRKEAK